MDKNNSRIRCAHCGEKINEDEVVECDVCMQRFCEVCCDGNNDVNACILCMYIF